MREEEAPIRNSGGASPFQAKALTITREHGGKDDKEAPDWGRLNPRAIAQPSGLAEALPGQDVKVVNGDYNEHLMGNKATDILGNEVMTVAKNQTETVQQQTDLTYVHGRDIMVGDLDQLQVNGIQKKYVLGESEETYIRTHEVHAPDEFEIKHFESGMTFVEFKVLGVGASIKGRENEVKISGDKEAMVESFMEGLHEEVKAHHGEAEAHSDKAATSLEINARGNAAPDIGIGTPFR
jgi:hypothetical protein